VSRPLTIVVGEDQALVREGVVRMLERAGMTVTGTAADATDLVRLARAHRPDVVITDIRMPPTQTDEGLRAAREIRRDHPGTGVLVLSQHIEPRYAMSLLSESAEGLGYLLKDRVVDLRDLESAVRRVGTGGSALDPLVVAQLVRKERPDDPVARLSPREREVLELMAEGKTNQGIADELVVTVPAVEKHVTSIFSKFDMPATPSDHRRVLAVLRFLGG
jgi:DNA-binding NarL/FixJ family response regulator